jgi:methylated-DNA-[protein]-cysteine S-methyltransferase
MFSRDDVVLAAGFTTDHDRLVDLIDPALRPAGPLRARHGGPVAAAVERYLNGHLTALDEVTLRWAGGPFQQRAWTAMRQVPAGSVISYGELARRAGADGWEAARAAGQACARNPNSLFVP